ncbi:MAG: hypothetical protein H3C54_02460 [Taibaiella sp.]|nr:hypothetical protein [Taibaiella sp.]
MNYNGFPYLAAELSAFAVACGIFVISLKDGKIVHFTPDDEAHFYNWLISTSIREVVPAC